MNQSYLFKKAFVVVLFISLSCTLLQAQARYKHMPRVKIKKTNVEVVTNQQEPVVQTITENTIEPETIDQVTTETANIASEPVSFGEKTIATIPVKKHTVKPKPKTKLDIPSLFKMISTMHKKLGKPETVKKTNASVAVILLIIFYILGAVFAVVAVLFLYIPPGNFIMFLVFLILGIVFALAASILSILLKFGVIN